MERIWTITVLVSVMILGLFPLNDAFAGAVTFTIFGTAHQDAEEATLYSIALDGTATAIGTGTGIERVGAIDFTPDGELLYAIGLCSDSFGVCPVEEDGETALFTIDTTTGIGTFVNVFDADFGFFFGEAYPDMSFNSGSTLFVNQRGELVTIDRVTGVVTDKGPMTNEGGNGLSFGAATLYHADDIDLSIIDQTNGGDISSINLDYSDFPDGPEEPRINAMDQDESTGTMFVSVNTARFGGGPNYLGTVDLSNGVVTNLGETVAGIDGLAVQSDDVVECVSNDQCDDGLFCNGDEVCSPATGMCVSGSAPVCSDGVSCTADSCNEATNSCDNTPRDGLCSDGLFCNGDEICDPVNDCQSGTAIDCSNGDVCTTGFCDETADACDGINLAAGTACGDPSSADCDAADSCDDSGNCLDNNAPDGTACGNPLTCFGGMCGGSVSVGGTSIPIDQSALLLAGAQSVSMWMIPVVIAGVGIGVFVIKRRK